MKKQWYPWKMIHTWSIVHIHVQLLGVVTPVSSRYNLCHFGAAEKASLSRFVPLLQRLLEKRETKGAACCDIRGTVLVILGPSGIPVAKCV